MMNVIVSLFFNVGKRLTRDQILGHISSEPSVLPDVQCCKHCKAQRFYLEPNGFCCAGGTISLVSNEVSQELYNLYTSRCEESVEFHKFVRTYNNSFAFTSFGVKYDKNLCENQQGIYTFRVQGQVYHYINELIPTNSCPTYLQLYFYDTEHELENRMNTSSKLSARTLRRIVKILESNPYAVFFRNLSNIQNLEVQQIVLKSDIGLDQRVFNLPSASQVAGIWIEDTNAVERRERDIMVYAHSGFSHRVRYYFGCYDPLQYPLLFPLGESGWHQGIRKKHKDADIGCQGDLLFDAHQMLSADDLINKETRGNNNSWLCFK